MNECIFCSLDSSRIESENNLFILIQDLYPVTDGHRLIIPKRHIASFFDLTDEEEKAFILMLKETKNAMKSEDSLPSWWTDKVTLASNYLNTSRDYLLNPDKSKND